MKKILNPWEGVEGYFCFGCAPQNPSGLKMDFYEDGDEIVSYWQPEEKYQGWLHTLHGGIQAVLLDEICGWVIIRKLQTTGVTSKMETRYLKPVSTQRPPGQAQHPGRPADAPGFHPRTEAQHCHHRRCPVQRGGRMLHTGCLHVLCLFQGKSPAGDALPRMPGRRRTGSCRRRGISAIKIKAKQNFS